MLSMGIAKQAESLCALCVRTLNVCFFVAISCKQLEHILQEATFIILFAVNGYVDSSVSTRAFALLPGLL